MKGSRPPTESDRTTCHCPASDVCVNCHTVVVCPACEAWQVDYSDAILLTYLPRPWPLLFALNSAFQAMVGRVDDVVMEHMVECYGVPT